MAHTLTLCVITKSFSFDLTISNNFWIILVVSCCSLIIIALLTLFCIFSTIHRLIRPLRVLIEKMKEIMSSENPDNELKEEGSSLEIAALYKVFHDLIQDKLFSQNAFLQRPDCEDVISIMDLAKTCLMYQNEKNIKAAGVCYNNIANLHFKNGKFLIAAQDFCKAIRLAKQQINVIKQKGKDASEYEEVRAHRTYQLAISNYKYVRYELRGQQDNAGRN